MSTKKYKSKTKYKSQFIFKWNEIKTNKNNQKFDKKNKKNSKKKNVPTYFSVVLNVWQT